ncbi:MAG TPA: YlxM family DNA-binding protein [Limnochordales bacterium]
MTADKQVRMHLLYDFYGQLLTDKQRCFFELYHHDDLSLGEIAEQHGVSRQAVYDILKRAERTLEDLEAKLELVARWQRERRVAQALDQELAALADEVARLFGGGETGAPPGAAPVEAGAAGAGASGALAAERGAHERSEAAASIQRRIRAIREQLRALAGDEP